MTEHPALIRIRKRQERQRELAAQTGEGWITLLDGGGEGGGVPQIQSNQGDQSMLTLPEHLREAGRAFFGSVSGEYNIGDAAGIALLTTAAECVDRMRAAQASIAQHGELVIDRYGAPKLNPACALEKDARNGFLAALRALNLDLEPLRDGPGRPTQ